MYQQELFTKKEMHSPRYGDISAWGRAADFIYKNAYNYDRPWEFPTVPFRASHLVEPQHYYKFDLELSDVYWLPKDLLDGMRTQLQYEGFVSGFSPNGNTTKWRLIQPTIPELNGVMVYSQMRAVERYLKSPDKVFTTYFYKENLNTYWGIK